MSAENSSKTENQKEPANIQYFMDTIKQLQTEIEEAKIELRKMKRVPSGRIGIVFAVPGVMSLAFSIYSNSPILAFIGLGLTFWGALFFFVKPIKYVKSSLLHSSTVASYLTIDRIIQDLKYKGKSYYVPPYPKEVYLPEHLKGLKEMIVFISAEANASMPSIEEVAKSRFLTEKPKGICVAPPGLGLLAHIEQELKTDITKLELGELCDSLPKLILEDFQLAKEIEMKPEDNEVYLRILDSTYKDLYAAEANLKSIHLLGCPLTSAIACAIARNTGKVVTIQKDSVSLDAQTIEVWFSFVEG